jgi:hypothetical protein
VDAESEFTEFVAQRAHVLLRIAYTLTGDQQAAEDLVQTALAKAFLRWRRPTEPMLLPGGMMLGARTDQNLNYGDDGRPLPNEGSLVWNPAARRYESVPYPVVVPAPAGTLAAVWDGLQQFGLLDLASGEVRWLPGVDGMYLFFELPAWSPDGRHVAVLDLPKEADPSVLIVDTDASFRRVPINWFKEIDEYCGLFCQVGWQDADTLTLAIAHGTAGEPFRPTYAGEWLISAVDGSREGTIDLPGAYAAQDDWSTDGRYVTLIQSGSKYGSANVVYDTVERRVVRKSAPPLKAWWVSPTESLEFNGDSLQLVQLDGSVTATYPAPVLKETYYVVLVPN